MPPVFTRSALPSIVGTPLGHLWTIAYHLERKRQIHGLGTVESFFATVPDPFTGDVTLSGTLHSAVNPASSNRDLVVLIHGLGGSAESGYMLEATGAALQLGFNVLRVSLRGADAQGTDFYHAGLFADVLRVLNQPTVQRFDNVYVLGISLGGHVALRTAGADVPANVRAVAALCPPLDLGACSAAFDKKRQWLFRRHVLDSLKQSYARFATHHAHVCNQLSLPSAKAANAIRSIGEWDRTIVAPRHGFASASEYYATQSAGPRFGEIHLPTLVLTTRWDPMVPYETTVHLLVPNTGFGNESLEVVGSTQSFDVPNTWQLKHLTPHVRHVELAVGGHIAFPNSGDATVFTQTLRWLKQHAATSHDGST